MIPITIVFLICVFFEKSDYQRSKECLPPFTKKEAEEYYNQTYNQDRITISETKRSIEGIGFNNQNES
jgi:hypothetical protein